jgi:hypothetical protein
VLIFARSRSHAVQLILTLVVVLALAACTDGQKKTGIPQQGAATAAMAPSASGSPNSGTPFAAGAMSTPSKPAPVSSAAATMPADASATASATATETTTPAPSATPATPSPPRVLVPDQTPPSGKITTGQWAEVNTNGSCLKVRVSFEDDSLAIDCLPYKLLVFVDGARTINGTDIVHLRGRGYVHPEGLTAVVNSSEAYVPFADRPHGIGTVAFTAPDGNVWIVGADGAAPMQITGTGAAAQQTAFYSSMAWSPDGARLLLRRESDTNHDVQIYEANKGVRSIYPPPGIVAPVNPGIAAWSADSGHVLVTDYDQSGDPCDHPINQYTLRSIDVATGATVELYHGESKGYIAGIAASPDAHSVALLIGTGCDAVSFGTCLLALQPDPVYGVQAGQLRCPRGANAGQVAWSGDGRYLAFTSRLQGRGDESALSTGLPLQIMDPRSATFYPIAWPLQADRNIIGVVWMADNRTLRIQEEVPRDLTDTSLPERVIRRITVDGSRFPITEMAGDRLLDVRPLLNPSDVRGDYILASGARGELWVVALAQQDARWQLTDVAAGASAWSH